MENEKVPEQQAVASSACPFDDQHLCSKYAEHGCSLMDALFCQLVVVDRQGRIMCANREFIDMHGLTMETILGRRLDEFMTQPSMEKLLEGTSATSLLYSSGSSVYFQNSIVRDGRVVGAVQMVFSDSGSIAFPKDQRTYSHISEDLHTLFESNWDVIYASDKNGITLEVSSASHSIWGVDADKLIGKSVYELEKERIYYPSITRMVLETKKRVQAIQTTATGKRLMVLGTPVKDENGEIVRVINTSRLILSENELRLELEGAKFLMEGYKRELESLRVHENAQAPFIYHSTQMQNIAALAMKVSKTDITVLIMGESGVGKEVLASYIHDNSMRREKPYIKINCGAIPETLLESELFGYEKGAFTGAERGGKPGMFELANNGTLFLDEIGEIPLPLQVKLLRVLQENELMRLGGTRPIRVDVRIIAATNRDLMEEVQKGRFRKDLYYRLNVVPVCIPPLCERPDDILPLSMVFLEKYNKKYCMHKTFSPAVIEHFMSYRWDGNIRELQNTIERLVILSPLDMIQTEDLPDAFLFGSQKDVLQINRIIPLKDAQRMLEQKLIDMARQKYHTTTQIAEALGVNQSTISRKLNQDTE